MSTSRDAVATLLALLTALQPSMALAQVTPATAPVPAEPPPPSVPDGRVVLEGAVDPKTYVVGPGDRLLVELWGVRELSSEIEVTAEGRLSVPARPWRCFLEFAGSNAALGRPRPR